MGASARRPRLDYSVAGVQLQETESERDLGVNIQADLSPEIHINGIVRTAYSFLSNVRVAFRHMDKEMFRNIYVTYGSLQAHDRGGILDLTFVSNSLKQDATWRVHPLVTSDHYGIHLTLPIPEIFQTPAPPPRWNFKKADWGRFQEHLSNWFSTYVTSEDIDQAEAEL
ncbi:hypothetical protein SK128_006901, partial [Halocaridina rubra]